MSKTLTAERVETVNPKARGNQVLWKLSRPIEYGWRDEKQTTEYVVTSAVVAIYSGAETYIFPADSTGEVVDWGELPGSYRGGLDHDEAIRRLCCDDGWES